MKTPTARLCTAPLVSIQSNSQPGRPRPAHLAAVLPARHVWFAALLLAAPLTHAADAPPGALAEHHWLDFGVQYSQTRAEFRYDGVEADTKVGRIGIVWREPFGERVLLGLLGGYTYVTQTGDPLTAGRDLDGYYAGVSADVTLARFARATVYVSARYVYEEVRDDSDDASSPSVELSWNDWRAALGASLRLSAATQLFAGADYGWKDGEERITGTLDATRRFERSQPGAFLGIALNDNADGTIGIFARSGYERGAGIYFRRLF